MEKKNVLIVEDDLICALCLKNFLENNNYNVLYIAIKGEEAINKTDALQPDVLLTDIFLKNGLTGIDVVKAVNQKHQIPVIYITALTDSKVKKMALKTKPFAFINKPYNKKELSRVLSRLFG